MGCGHILTLFRHCAFVKNSATKAIGVMGTIMGLLILCMGRPFMTLSLLSSNTGWIMFLVNPATIKYNKSTGTIDIGKILEDCKDPDEVSD